ncbi:hypothetical protein PoB_003203800 [Plakobranchus ocellatus]|uniref:Uncharacterized protein n=1 Tax=Plakobranchus ocellatus TaxID=259542 RepID=A0AAV4AG55_9GAST|nr:hypothetical protein PoB_003203800 [Plakobranchus ocellatus]
MKTWWEDGWGYDNGDDGDCHDGFDGSDDSRHDGGDVKNTANGHDGHDIVKVMVATMVIVATVMTIVVVGKMVMAQKVALVLFNPYFTTFRSSGSRRSNIETSTNIEWTLAPIELYGMSAS